MVWFCPIVRRRRLPFSHYASVHLLEADVFGVLMETLTAHVETVFADQPVPVAASSAAARPLTVLLGVGIPDVAETHFAARFSQAYYLNRESSKNREILNKLKLLNYKLPPC